MRLQKIKNEGLKVEQFNFGRVYVFWKSQVLCQRNWFNFYIKAFESSTHIPLIFYKASLRLCNASTNSLDF